MTPHIHSSASSKSSLFKRLVIITIVVSVVIYLAFTFSLFKVPTKFQKQSTTTTTTSSLGKEEQVLDSKPTGIIVQTPTPPVVAKEKPLEKNDGREHEDLGTNTGSTPLQIVQELDGKTFDEFIKSSPNTLVYVFSPYCSHCIQFSPTFDKLVGELDKIYGGKINIGKVVGPKNIDSLVVPLGIRGYPTLMFYTAGDLKSKKFYEGARKIPDILAFIEKQLLK